MSKYIYPLFITVLFFSCAVYFPYSASNQTKSITDIPLKPTVAHVDCFINDQTPSKPYYKVNVVEVTGAANASYDELLISLKNKAGREGLDGVIILDKRQEIGYENYNYQVAVKDTTVDYYRQLATPYQKLSGVGIKYAENINYLDSIIKSTSFEFNNDNENKNGTINFDFYGNPLTIVNNTLGNYYYDSIEPFELGRHLCAAVKGWVYKTDPVLNDKVVGFKNKSDGFESVNVNTEENDLSKFNYKLREPVQNKIKKYTVKIEVGMSGKIIKKTIQHKTDLIWVEEIYYDHNKVTGFRRYRINKGKQENIFTATNHFYSGKDLPEPLSVAVGSK